MDMANHSFCLQQNKNHRNPELTDDSLIIIRVKRVMIPNSFLYQCFSFSNLLEYDLLNALTFD